MDPQIEAIVREFQLRYGLIVAVASRYVPTPDAVQDVVQQVFVDFAEAALKGDWDATRDSAPYLAQITKNRALKLWREQRDCRPSVRRKIGERLTHLYRHQERSVSASNERLEALNECVETLPPKSREILNDHYAGNLSLEEIARRRDMPSGTLRKTIYRIRLQLKTCIERKFE